MIFRIENRRIYLKKNIKSLVWFQVYYLLFYGFFRDVIGLPGIIAYVLDLLNIILFAYIVCSKKIFRVQNGYYKKVFLWISLFVLVTFIGLIVVEGSMILYIWGFRNIFRYYMFFISCALLLDMSDIREIIDIFKRIYIINVLACTFELLMGYRGDYVGGIFGTQQGCNGYLNLFLIIVSAIYITEYLEKKVGLLKLIAVILTAFYIMSISELKVFLFELPVIIFLALVNAKFSLRKIIIIMTGILGLVVGVSMLGYFFEDSGISFFTSDAIYKYMGDRGYTNSGDLSRFNAVSQIYKRFLKGDIEKELFGIGLGNAAYSSAFSFFNSNFYLLYNKLHYQWFTDAFIYIELGSTGLFFFEGFFVIIYILSKKISRYRKFEDDKVKTMVQVSGIVSILSMFLTIYNSSLSMDSAYVVYFFLSIPIVVDLHFKKNNSYIFRNISVKKVD